MSKQIGATKILFVDNFSTNGPIDSAKWDYNEFSKGGSFYGRTQQRQNLPSAENGVLQLRLDSYNPTDAKHETFLGSEAITKQSFDTTAGGIAFECKARFEQPQRGIIGGFFTFAGPANDHDEIDVEALSNDINEIQTNIYHDEPLGNGHPISYPISGSLTDWHTYRIEWLPNMVRWLVDGEVVRTEKTLVPDKAMQMHFNIWAPPANWPTGDAGLKPASSQGQNQTWYFDITSVKVEQLSTFVGTTAADALVGSAMHDWMHGGLGDDALQGGAGADTVRGGAHNDTLLGEKGADLLHGGGGNDILHGGRGSDRLRGGDGADTFAFTAISDSPTGSGRDKIADFHAGFGDKIDLSAIDANIAVDGDQAFAFIGKGAFGGNAGELRYSDAKGGILVSADVDGDEKADFQLFVAKLSALESADFVL